MNPVFCIAIAALLLVALTGLCGYRKYRSLAPAIRNATTCGYVAPPPSAALVKKSQTSGSYSRIYSSR